MLHAARSELVSLALGRVTTSSVHHARKDLLQAAKLEPSNRKATRDIQRDVDTQ